MLVSYLSLIGSCLPIFGIVSASVAVGPFPWEAVCPKSMKIQSDGLQGSTPLEAERTQSTTQTSGGSTPEGRKVAGHDGDSVEISSISAHLSEANSVDSQHRTNRIAELSAIHARGDYHANAEKLSRALVAHSIRTAEGGDK